MNHLLTNLCLFLSFLVTFFIAGEAMHGGPIKRHGRYCRARRYIRSHNPLRHGARNHFPRMNMLAYHAMHYNNPSIESSNETYETASSQ